MKQSNIFQDPYNHFKDAFSDEYLPVIMQLFNDLKALPSIKNEHHAINVVSNLLNCPVLHAPTQINMKFVTLKSSRYYAERILSDFVINNLDKVESGQESRLQKLFGDCYYFGMGVKRNHGKACELYILAAEKKPTKEPADAQFYYKQGVDIEEHLGEYDDEQYGEAFRMFVVAAEKGNVDAECQLGRYYEYGLGVSHNPEKAIEHYRVAADKENGDALVSLGNCYRKGNGIEQSIEKAVEMYEAAANLGSISGLRSMAHCYRYGIGVTQSLEKSFLLVTDAARKGNSSALYDLGIRYQKGIGTRVNDDKAFQLFKLVAKEEPSAHYYLGLCYQDGRGTDKNHSAALVSLKYYAEEFQDDKARNDITTFKPEDQYIKPLLKKDILSLIENNIEVAVEAEQRKVGFFKNCVKTGKEAFGLLDKSKVGFIGKCVEVSKEGLGLSDLFDIDKCFRASLQSFSGQSSLNVSANKIKEVVYERVQEYLVESGLSCNAKLVFSGEKDGISCVMMRGSQKKNDGIENPLRESLLESSNENEFVTTLLRGSTIHFTPRDLKTIDETKKSMLGNDLQVKYAAPVLLPVDRERGS